MNKKLECPRELELSTTLAVGGVVYAREQDPSVCVRKLLRWARPYLLPLGDQSRPANYPAVVVPPQYSTSKLLGVGKRASKGSAQTMLWVACSIQKAGKDGVEVATLGQALGMTSKRKPHDNRTDVEIGIWLDGDFSAKRGFWGFI